MKELIITFLLCFISITSLAVITKQEDKTYEVLATIERTENETVITVDKEDLAALHKRIFGETVITEQSIRSIVILEIVYIPLLFVTLLLIFIVNARWNKAFKRLKENWDNVEQTEERIKVFGMLELQRMNMWDRAFVYGILWFVSLIMDALFMTYGVYSSPWLAIPTALFVLSKVLKKLVDGSKIKGYDDSDIVSHFDKLAKELVFKPITQAIADIFRHTIVDKKGRRDDP